MRVSDVLRDKPTRLVALPPTACIADAAKLMRSEQIGAVLVRDYRGSLLGVISERDLALAIASGRPGLSTCLISGLMAVGGPTARPGDAVREVMRVMTERRARHIPVLEGETIVGVVSMGDVLRARLAEKSEENAVLQDLARARIPA